MDAPWVQLSLAGDGKPRLEKKMREHAKKLEFEEAAVLRDEIQELEELQIFAG